MANKITCAKCGEQIQTNPISRIRWFTIGLLVASILSVVFVSSENLTPEQQARHEQLVADAQNAINNSNFDRARVAIEEAISLAENDSTEELLARLNELQALKEAKAISSSDIKGNIEAYSRLASLAPSNEGYKNKIAYYQQKQKEKDALEEVERQRLLSLNSTGNWKNTFYVDEFGEPTTEPYIRYSAKNGTFSNTATQNSPLNAVFLVNRAEEVLLMLYEYDGNNPVKSYGTQKYRVLLQDKDGNRFQIQATSNSDRLHFSIQHSQLLHHAFMKGGNVKIRLYEQDNQINEYSINLINTDHYNNAYRKLTEVQKKT